MNRLIDTCCVALAMLLVLGSCGQKTDAAQERQESQRAKQLLQGIWVDQESENVAFKMQGDTIYYPDSTSAPAVFRVIDDTLFVGEANVKYPIVKQLPHVFWFKNGNGDVVKLTKSNDDDDDAPFVRKRHTKILTTSQITKTDTVVLLDNERYHCYLAVNPSKYKVVKSSLNDDGLQVENVYYDNIIHLSIFRGSARVFSQDFRKAMFARYVPEGFLNQSVLGNMEYDKSDANGFHFVATIGVPDEASCYLVEVVVSSKGALSMKLLEY